LNPVGSKIALNKDDFTPRKRVGGSGLTVRDAISDLPNPEKGHREIANHLFNPGARSYPGYTGSPLDERSKTLKAGDHGVPGGENMLARVDGSLRYFTVREAARLQTFLTTIHSKALRRRPCGNWAMPFQCALPKPWQNPSPARSRSADAVPPFEGKSPECGTIADSVADDQHHFDFDLDRGIRVQVVEKLEDSPFFL
jgi:hypothetical protein